jgi:hypothetical protein
VGWGLDPLVVVVVEDWRVHCLLVALTVMPPSKRFVAYIYSLLFVAAVDCNSLSITSNEKTETTEKRHNTMGSKRRRLVNRTFHDIGGDHLGEMHGNPIVTLWRLLCFIAELLVDNYCVV